MPESKRGKGRTHAVGAGHGLKKPKKKKAHQLGELEHNGKGGFPEGQRRRGRGRAWSGWEKRDAGYTATGRPGRGPGGVGKLIKRGLSQAPGSMEKRAASIWGVQRSF